jgi:class 3 adenylate cyclase/alpha-beta hydrolase superfamily lysophospholipase
MSLPETRYARRAGATIAYQVVGEGPLDLLLVPGFLSHVEWSWELPAFARFLTRLASFSRLIVFDKRGTGMSDPVDGIPSPEERTDDLRAVLDSAGSERAALLGVFDGAALAILYASEHPERVSALALYAGLAKFTQGDGYELGWSPGAIQLYLSATEEGWGSADGAALLAPSLADDDAYRSWFSRLLRLGASPGRAVSLMRMNTELDVRDRLSSLQLPTLVLHRSGDTFVDSGHSRYLADHIPGARLVELPGDDHWPFAGDAEALVGELEELVTGERRTAPDPERVLTTLLFTDIVGSTETASSLGDDRWRRLLEEHDALVRRELTRYGGREIVTTGDGFLATFTGPTQAIRCAAAIREALRRLDIQVRAGVHAGECELMGSDLGGIAVHVGARVAGAAGAGEILVSSTVSELVAGSGIRFDPRGSFALKGVDGERQLFAAEVGS